MRRGAALCGLLVALLWPTAAGRPAEPADRGAELTTPIRGTIDYLRSIDSVREFSKPKSVWSKMLEWVAGPAETPSLWRPYAVAQDSEGRGIVAGPGAGGVAIFQVG